MPAAAACAATELARLPVEAQATVSNPSSRARVRATETTRSLNDSVGWLTVSFLMYNSSMPRYAPRFFARTSGVSPAWGPIIAVPSTGQQVDVAPHAVRALLDLLPGDRALDLLIVVFHFEWAEAHLTDVDGFGWIFLPTFPAHERFHFRHGDTFATSYVDPEAHMSARRCRLPSAG